MHRKSTGKHARQFDIQHFIPGFKAETRWESVTRFFRNYFSPGSLA